MGGGHDLFFLFFLAPQGQSPALFPRSARFYLSIILQTVRWIAPEAVGRDLSLRERVAEGQRHGAPIQPANRSKGAPKRPMLMVFLAPTSPPPLLLALPSSVPGLTRGQAPFVVSRLSRLFLAKHDLPLEDETDTIGLYLAVSDDQCRKSPSVKDQIAKTPTKRCSLGVEGS